MPSTSERATLPGVLRGQGQEARCTVEADKVSLPGGSDVNYTNYRINPGSVSKRLPDGNYTLTEDVFARIFQQGKVIFS